MTRRHLFLAAVAVAGLASVPVGAGQATGDAALGRPSAVIDLATDDGVRLVRGAWRYADARVIEIDHRAPGADLKASGAPVRTLDIEPKAGLAGFDDDDWDVIPATSLTARRGHGRLSFGWYRIAVTVPGRIGAFDPTGTTAVLEVVVDDYSEVWVNGELAPAIGQTGAGVIRGWNAPNRIVLGRDVRPGQMFEIAVFGANGPISAPPANFIWIRSATIDFHRPAPDRADVTPLKVTRVDAALDRIVPAGATIEKLAGGFDFTEGPIWMPAGHLLFSDPNRNTIYRWSPDEPVSVFRPKSGYSGPDIDRYKQPGSNGLAIDPDGRLTVAEHGNRRITRTEKNGVITVLADRYDGRRLNSPNDLVYGPDGALYFTDPPFGLPAVFDDPGKALPFSGVYRVQDGRVTLLTAELTGPNGLAFSPDGRWLYVGNWDERRKVVMRYPMHANGTAGRGTVFADLTSAPGEDAIDGVKVDTQGHVYVSGPGGVWIFDPSGRHLGTITGPEHPHNLAFGDADRRTLYLTAQTGLYRVRLLVAGR